MTENEEQYEGLGEYNEEGLKSIGVVDGKNTTRTFGNGLFSGAAGEMTAEEQANLLDVNLDTKAPSIWSVLGIIGGIAITVWAFFQLL